MGRPEWCPERGITDSAVEAPAQAMISQPQRGRGRAAHTVMTQKYYSFDMNNGTTDPGFIPVPGTSHRTFSGRYPIMGYKSGVCTLTGTPGKNAEQTLTNCVVTAIS